MAPASIITSSKLIVEGDVGRSQIEAEDAVIFSRARRQEKDGDRGKSGVVAQAAANIKPVAAGNHNVEKKERGRLALRIGNEIGGGVKETGLKTCRLKMMLHQPGYIGFVFQNKYGLAQNRG